MDGLVIQMVAVMDSNTAVLMVAVLVGRMVDTKADQMVNLLAE
jgi:hypothetical protein